MWILIRFFSPRNYTCSPAIQKKLRDAFKKFAKYLRYYSKVRFALHLIFDGFWCALRRTMFRRLKKKEEAVSSLFFCARKLNLIIGLDCLASLPLNFKRLFAPRFDSRKKLIYDLLFFYYHYYTYTLYKYCA